LKRTKLPRPAKLNAYTRKNVLGKGREGAEGEARGIDGESEVVSRGTKGL